jgi:hypothetical protein
MSKKRWTSLLTSFFGLVVLVAVASPVATGGARTSEVRPVIGQPIAQPVLPLAGKPCVVAFDVKRNDAKPVLRGTMVYEPAVSGAVIQHAEWLTNGTARLALMVPAGAAGKLLTVRLTITAYGHTVTRVASFRIVKTLPEPVRDADAGASIAALLRP